MQLQQCNHFFSDFGIEEEGVMIWMSFFLLDIVYESDVLSIYLFN